MKAIGPGYERGTKYCNRCDTTKQISEFYPRLDTKDKLYSYCKACHTNIYKERSNLNPTHYRKIRMKSQIKRNFNIDLATYEKLRDSQNGHCLMCHKKSKLGLDHDHQTGKLRGFLCIKCNTGLGLIGDDMFGVARCLRYLMGRSIPAYAK